MYRSYTSYPPLDRVQRIVGGGGGGVERDQISDIRPPKKKISYIRPPPPPQNQISDITRSQKSDIWL